MESQSVHQRVGKLTRSLKTAFEESQLISQALEEKGHYLESEFAQLSYELDDMLNLLQTLKVSLWQEQNRAKRGIK